MAGTRTFGDGTAGAVDVLVIRHGQSVWNAEGRWQGQADPPLSALGRDQAEQATRVLGSFAAIVASDLERAHHTAAIIGELLGIGPVVTDRRLRERHAGPWQGRTRDEIERDWPGWVAAGRFPDDFEHPEDAARRATEALVHWAREHRPGPVLVVSHGGVLRALRRVAGLPEVAFGNVGGAWIRVVDDELHHGDVVHLLDRETSQGPTL
jgi:probable phosphoglycerate mutase